jgi:hypothetical protein
VLIKRFVASICGLACAAVMPSAALAAPKPAPAPPAHGSVTGTITFVGWSTVTIQTGGRSRGVVSALTTAADRLTAQDFPYVYGGGHAQAGSAGVGIKGPGHNGRRIGFDCSGSVAAVLAAAGLWPAGSGVPNDAGVIQQLLREKLIARGPGAAPNEVTLYDDPGVHIFMNIDGRFFGTSDGGGGDPKGGPTWIDDGAPDSWDHAYKRYHVVASVLGSTTTAGNSFTFQTSAGPAITAGAEPGDEVTISYTQTTTGTMTASAIGYAGATATSGTVTSIAADRSAVTIETAGDGTVTFASSAVTGLIAGLQLGDGVQVTYSKDALGLLVAHALVLVSTPSVPPPAQPPAGPTPPVTPPVTRPVPPPVTAPAAVPPAAPAGGTGSRGRRSSSDH